MTCACDDDDDDDDGETSQSRVKRAQRNDAPQSTNLSVLARIHCAQRTADETWVRTQTRAARGRGRRTTARSRLLNEVKRLTTGMTLPLAGSSATRRVRDADERTPAQRRTRIVQGRVVTKVEHERARIRRAVDAEVREAVRVRAAGGAMNRRRLSGAAPTHRLSSKTRMLVFCGCRSVRPAPNLTGVGESANQKPAMSLPAAALRRKVLVGFVIQNVDTCVSASEQSRVQRA